MADCSQKLADKDFQNWLKSALAVSIVKKGIEQYVLQMITEFHQNALKDILSVDEVKYEALCSSCTNASLLLNDNKTKRVLYQRQEPLTKCPNQICDRLKLKIILSHAYGDPSWKNTSVSKWCQCPWEIAKCYMPPDGYTSTDSASDTDLNGVLSVMMNHLEFHHECNACEKARNVTKEVRHSPNLSMDDQELEEHLNALITFLNCQSCHANNPASDEALQDLRKLKDNKLPISTDTVTEVLRNEIKESTQSALKNMDQRKSECLQEIIEEMSKLHSIKSESLEEILTAKKSALRDIHNAKASTLDEIKRTSDQYRQHMRKSSFNDSYETLKDELKEDLLMFNKKLYSTIPLSPLFEKQDTPLVGFYVPPNIQCIEYPMRESLQADIKTEVSCIGEIFQKKHTNNIYVASKTGLGKTVFCKRLVVTWCHAQSKRPFEENFEIAEDDLRVMKEFDYIFLVPLRETRCSDCDVDEMIHYQIIRHLARSQRYKLDFLQDILTKERCLIILDGLDEWTHPKEKKCKTTNDIPHRKARENCTILTTTRTWKFCQLSLSINEIDNLIQITGLGDKAAEQLVNNAVSKFSSVDTEEDKRKIEDFHRKMQEDSLNKFKCVPLILIHLICLWHKEQTIGESYCEIFSNIIGFHLHRAQVRSNPADSPELKKRKVDMPNCIKANKYCGAFYEVLVLLGQLAFHTFFNKNREISLVFDIKTAKKYLGKNFKFCLSAGLLTQNKGIENDLIGSVPRVSFAHKTFQEFFAALHLCSVVREVEMKPVLDICCTVKDILSVSNFYIFLNGICPDKARTLSHKFCDVIAGSDTVRGYRSDMGSWNYFVGYNETIKRVQTLFVCCVNESANNGHKPVQFQIDDIIIDSDFQVENYSNVLKPIMKNNGKDVKSLKIRDVKTKADFSSIIQLLRTNGPAALEKLDLKCEICEKSLEFLLKDSVHTLRCFIMKGGQWLGNSWYHNHVSLSNKSLQIIWGIKKLEELYLRNIEMTHKQLNRLVCYVSESLNMKHIGLGFMKCKKHGDNCSDITLDLSKHSSLRMLEVGSIPLSEIHINTHSLEVCYAGSFSKSGVLFKILTTLSRAPKLHVFCCGFLSSQLDKEKMLETIPSLDNLQHLWLINTNFGCSTFQISPVMESIENIFMIRVQMNIETLRKLVEKVKSIKRTVRVGLFECVVEQNEDYEREIRHLKSSQTVHVIHDEAKDFIFKTLS